MSSDDDKNRQSPPTNSSSSPRGPRQWPDEENPFVAFRRFADEQISSMLQSVMGLPSMITPPVSDQWSIFTDDQGPTSISSKSQGNEGRNAQQEDPLSPYRYGNRWGKHGGPSVFWRTDFDDFFPFASRFMHTFLPPFGGDGGFEDSATWPGAFLVFSPYSPINLERRPGRGDHGGGVFSSLMSSMRLASESDKEFEPKEDGNEPHWHEAFEDLMRLENGKPMLDSNDTAGAVAKRETGMAWLKGMVQRGSLGDGWKWHQNTENSPDGYFMLERGRTSPQEPGQENVQEPAKEGYPKTEQDMYERFLHDLERREHEFSKLFDESLTLRFLLGDPERKRELLERQRGLFDAHQDQGQRQGLARTNNDTYESQESTTSSYHSEWSQQTDNPSDVVTTRTKTVRYNTKDGSTHTKTIKTNIFRDGREETEETSSTIPPANKKLQSPAGQGTTGDADQNGNANENDPSKGWFWSR